MILISRFFNPVTLTTSFFIIAWATFSFLLDNPILPSPLGATSQFFSDLRNSLPVHLLVSIFRLLTGMLLGCLLGIFLGILIGSSKKLDYWTSPLIYILYVIPKIILLPLFIVLIGIGDRSKVSLIAITAFFQTLVIIKDAVRAMEEKYFHSVYSLGKSKLHVFIHVSLHGSLPKIFTALRISLATSLAILFIIENFATERGIGFYIIDGLTKFDYSAVFSGIMAISLIGTIFYKGIDLLEMKFCRWNVQKS